MPANAYTQLLYESSGLTLATHNLGGPASGFRWVVRDVSWFNNEFGWSQGLNGCFLTGGSGGIFAAPPLSVVKGQCEYQWEGRQVIDYPNHLTAVCNDAGWALIVSGYVLSLP